MCVDICGFVYLDVFVCILHVFAVQVSAVCVVQCAWCCHYCCNDSVPANGEPVLSLHKHFFPFLAANLIPFEILFLTGMIASFWSPMLQLFNFVCLCQ